MAVAALPPPMLASSLRTSICKGENSSLFKSLPLSRNEIPHIKNQGDVTVTHDGCTKIFLHLAYAARELFDDNLLLTDEFIHQKSVLFSTDEDHDDMLILRTVQERQL